MELPDFLFDDKQQLVTKKSSTSPLNNPPSNKNSDDCMQTQDAVATTNAAGDDDDDDDKQAEKSTMTRANDNSPLIDNNEGDHADSASAANKKNPLQNEDQKDDRGSTQRTKAEAKPAKKQARKKKVTIALPPPPDDSSSKKESADDKTEMNDNAKETSTPPKRKRGRPRKDAAAASPSSAAAAATASPPKKKRGPYKKRKKAAATAKAKKLTEDDDQPLTIAAASALAQVAAAADASAPNNTSTSKKPVSRRATARLRKEIDSLHKEMEVAHYARLEDNGSLRRVVPKTRSKSYTKKRKSLEREDKELIEHNMAITTPPSERRKKRLRGAQAAQHDSVIQGSLIFGGEDENDDDDKDDNEEEEDGDEEGNEETEKEDDEEDGVENNSDEEEEDGEDIDDGQEDEAEEEESTLKQKPRRRGKRKFTRNARRVSRLRNFRSQRLAQREGEAIGLHIQGYHAEAIQKLKELAAEAPSAPQVYSALGTVYESMLKELQRSDAKSSDDEEPTKADVQRNPSHAFSPRLNEQIHLAKKAYASFHVSAVLYRRDYALWVKGADLAANISDLYTECLSLPNLPAGAVDLARRERRRWLSEAKNDYQAADNLHPPGVDVGAKLATIYIELGNLSHALTLLTDMKSRRGIDSSRPDFDLSYRAWTLYADLMLKIGFECQQWNHGDYSNEDYMFRRWLRKFSHEFDWRERRIQALIKALEAAAGSESCIRLLAWQKERAQNCADNASKDEQGDDQEKKATDDADEDRALLDAGNEDELLDFDKTTDEMELAPGSEAARARGRERAKLLNRTLPEITKTAKKIEAEVMDPESGDPESRLPFSASVATVSNIAAQLMKQMIQTDFFDGSCFVAEAVSAYMKERGARFDDRKSRSFGSVELNPVKPENGAFYDTLSAESDEEDSVMVLSDDEELENADNGVVASMRKGILPPLLRTLYGLALLGAGRRRYLALKCIEGVRHFAQEEDSWFRRDAKEDRTTAWAHFVDDHLYSTGRTSMVALAAKVLFQNSNDSKMTADMTEVFEDSDEYLASRKLMPVIHAIVERLSSTSLRRISCVLQISAALTRCLTASAKMSPSDENIINKLLRSLQRTTGLSRVLWKVDDTTGEIPTVLHVAITSAADAFHVLLSSSGRHLEEVSAEIQQWMSRFVYVRSAEFVNFQDGSSPLSSSGLPLDDAFLTAVRYKISSRCHNLIVATGVEAFPGWQIREFGANSIRRLGRPTYIGIRSSDGCIAGLVSTALRTELVRQWTKLRGFKSEFRVAVEILEKFEKLEEQEWFKQETQRLRDPDGSGNVALNGENDAIRICLQFAENSLRLAESSEDTQMSNGHIYNALSVLLPLSQYSLNVPLTKSIIGNISDGINFEKTMANAATEQVAPSLRPGYKRATSTKLKMRKKSETKYFWLDSENDVNPYANLINLTCSKCKDLWDGEMQQVNEESFDVDGSTAMAVLHEKTQQMRGCYSLESVERASLEIAAALLNVAASPLCENMFTVLQQAAAFAAKGLRKGKNDRYFKSRLPSHSCTPREMMVVIGRADCLQTIGFVSEASFLVSFAVKRCRSLRESASNWGIRWKLVAIHAYNVSVMARASDTSAFGELFVWDKDVIEEFDHIIKDGIEIFGRALLESNPANLADDDEQKDGDSGGEDEEVSPPKNSDQAITKNNAAGQTDIDRSVAPEIKEYRPHSHVEQVLPVRVQAEPLHPLGPVIYSLLEEDEALGSFRTSTVEPVVSGGELPFSEYEIVEV